MSEWGISNKGFKPKSFEAIKDELEQELQAQISPHLRFDNASVAGQLTAILSEKFCLINTLISTSLA